MASNCAWPSRLASTSRLITVSLRPSNELSAQFLLQSRRSLCNGNRLVDLVVQPLCLLLRNALFVPFLHVVVLLDQFVMMFLHVLDNRFEFFACKARQRPMNKLKIAATMKVI